MINVEFSRNGQVLYKNQYANEYIAMKQMIQWKEMELKDGIDRDAKMMKIK